MTRDRFDILKITLKSQIMYDIVSALRGPDAYHQSEAALIIKQITTAVLRDFLGMDSRYSADVRTPEQACSYWSDITYSGMIAARVYWKRNAQHFGRHVLAAFKALGRFDSNALAYLRKLEKMLDLRR